MRAFRPVLLVDAPVWSHARVAAALLEGGFLPQTAPNAQRALVFLADPAQRAETLVLPTDLAGGGAPALVAEARRLRPGLPALLVENGAEGEVAERLRLLLAERARDHAARRLTPWQGVLSRPAAATRNRHERVAREET